MSTAPSPVVQQPATQTQSLTSVAIKQLTGPSNTAQFGDQISVLVNWTVANDVWAASQAAKKPILIQICLGQEPDKIVAHCVGSGLESQTGEKWIARATVPDYNPYNLSPVMTRFVHAMMFTQSVMFADDEPKPNQILNYPITSLVVAPLERAFTQDMVVWK